MFDRHEYGSGSIYNNTTITEKRAPTDDSVHLLKEMEDAARAKIIETTVVSDTNYECKIHKCRDFMNAQDVYLAVYSLGGKKSNVQIRVDYREKLTSPQVACIIRDRVAVDIANEMIATAFMNMGK